jgi:hypothetical protein
MAVLPRQYLSGRTFTKDLPRYLPMHQGEMSSRRRENGRK